VPPTPHVVLGSGRLAGWRGITLAAVLVALGVAGGTILTRSGEPAEASAAPPLPAIVPQPMVAATVSDAKPAEATVAQSMPRRDDDLVQPPRHEPPRSHKPTHPAPEAPPPVLPEPVQPAPKVEPPKPVPAPVRAAPRPVDPWQRMSEALAGCAAEDLFGRIRCEYRVRTSYCEGHWGEVAQCPGAPANDHGQ
jgi:hypothetical protein